MCLGSFVNPSLVIGRVEVDPVTEGRPLNDHTLASVENVGQCINVLKENKGTKYNNQLNTEEESHLKISLHVKAPEHSVQTTVLTEGILGKLLLVISLHSFVRHSVVHLPEIVAVTIDVIILHREAGEEFHVEFIGNGLGDLSLAEGGGTLNHDQLGVLVKPLSGAIDQRPHGPEPKLPVVPGFSAHRQVSGGFARHGRGRHLKDES